MYNDHTCKELIELLAQQTTFGRSPKVWEKNSERLNNFNPLPPKATTAVFPKSADTLHLCTIHHLIATDWLI